MKKTRAQVESVLAVTRDGVLRAQRDLVVAQEEFAKADREWLEDGSKRHTDRRRDAEDVLERCTRLLRQAESKQADAEVEIAQVERDEDLAEIARLEAKLAVHGKTVDARAAEFILADRQVDALVFAAAAETRDACAAFDAAERLRDKHRLPNDAMRVGRRPDLAEVALRVRRAVTQARFEERRDPLAPHWLSDAPDSRDWRLRGATATEMDGLQHEAVKKAAGVHDADVVRVAAERVAAAKAAPTPEQLRAQGVVQRNVADALAADLGGPATTTTEESPT